MMATSVITPNRPVTLGQLRDMRADFQQQSELASKRRTLCDANGPDGLREYAEQRYWTGRVHTLDGLIRQMGGDA